MMDELARRVGNWVGVFLGVVGLFLGGCWCWCLWCCFRCCLGSRGGGGSNGCLVHGCGMFGEGGEGRVSKCRRGGIILHGFSSDVILDGKFGCVGSLCGDNTSGGNTRSHFLPLLGHHGGHLAALLRYLAASILRLLGRCSAENRREAREPRRSSRAFGSLAFGAFGAFDRITPCGCRGGYHHFRLDGGLGGGFDRFGVVVLLLLGLYRCSLAGVVLGCFFRLDSLLHLGQFLLRLGHFILRLPNSSISRSHLQIGQLHLLHLNHTNILPPLRLRKTLAIPILIHLEPQYRRSRTQGRFLHLFGHHSVGPFEVGTFDEGGIADGE
mmetsp:Transcript_11892/g.21986  ORF Transcript_11892/g.21986 Transcript_11892/m.21986 type:complete len:325 (+) Transcript_11892:1391-2365(+)